MKVYVTELLHHHAMEELAGFAEVHLASSTDEAVQAGEVVGMDAIISRGAKLYDSVVRAAAASGTRLVVRHAAGLDTVNVELCTELGVAVCNCPGANANSTAEQAVALALAISKNIRSIDLAYRHGAFTLSKPLTARKEELGYINHELMGKVAGVIGYGRIGRLVGEKMHYGFGMKVAAYDPVLCGREGVLPEGGVWCPELDDLLAMSDIVFVLAPLTASNHGMIGAHELEVMKTSAFLVNDGRGELIDEPALYEALRTKQIAGAALDMLAVEPPKSRHPFFDLDNIIVTPHCGSATVEATEKLSLMAVDNVRIFFGGGAPEGWVNREQLAARGA